MTNHRLKKRCVYEEILGTTDDSGGAVLGCVDVGRTVRGRAGVHAARELHGDSERTSGGSAVLEG